jgi:hypothetical protein
LNIPLEGIHRPEAAGGGVEIAGGVVVEVEVGVELFTGEEIVVRRGAGRVDQVAESVVVVGVGDSAGWLRQRPYALVPVMNIRTAPGRSIFIPGNFPKANTM